MTAHNHEKWMAHALELAAKAELAGEVPVGAVIVKDNIIVGEGWNKPISSNDPTAHAEITALRSAAEALKNYRLVDCTMYVTIEPCTMCAGAIVHGRIKRLVFGATEPKAGAVVSASHVLDSPELNHQVEYQGGVLGNECSEKVSAFFKRRREEKKKG